MAVEVKKYSAGYLEDCVSLLADAFVGNPLHRSAFGNDRIDQNRLFFRIGLRHMFLGQAFVALAEARVCGYVHFNEWPFCLPAPEEIPRAAATSLRPLGQAIPRMIQWFSRWCHADPAEPHVHLGPVGVAPGMQHQGIGTMLMRCYVNHLEAKRAPGYLETDRPESVNFYNKFGFAVIGEETLIGTPTWYMWRAPA